MKCPFCNKKLNRYDGHHIYKCKKNTLNDKYETKFQYILYNHKIISNKNNLYNEYVINLKSLPDIRFEYNISYRNILFLLEYFKIKKRTRKSSSLLISTNKYKKTCIEKYGVDNVSKLKYINTKKSLRNKKIKLNKDLVLKEQTYNWIKNESLFGHIKNSYKIKDKEIIKSEFNKIIKQYHNYWNELTDEQKNILSGENNPIESRISDILDKLNITYIKNFKLGQKKFDIKIYNTHLLIDIYGDLWHANPNIYKSNDILNFPFKNEKAIKIWNKDKMKNKYASNKGYKVICIWENDIKKMSNDELFIYITKLIKNNNLI